MELFVCDKATEWLLDELVLLAQDHSLQLF